MQKLQTPDMSKYTQYARAQSLAHHSRRAAPIDGDQWTKNPFLRCQVPQAIATSPDSLRQFYQSGIPQYRIIPPLSRGINSIN